MLMRCIARNILLCTLLLDDAEGLKHEEIWNAYYHFFIDAKSLEIIHLQAKKLYALATSMQDWHLGQYGKVLRFCDTGTLSKVRAIWGNYSTLDLSTAELATYDERFKENIRKVRAFGSHLLSANSLQVATGVCSAAPVGIAAMKHLPDLYRYYWSHGTTDQDPAMVSVATHSNPMFASLVTDTFMLHYGTDPILRFHLATAYIPLSRRSSLQPKLRGKTFSLSQVVDAARLQFQAWSISFRNYACQDLTLRFFAGDALAFCNILECRLTTRDAVSANMYRAPYGLEPLILNGEDYVLGGSAPVSFNVIDSSNLVDHLGAINVLVATSPLLQKNLSATLYTESLVRRSDSYKTLIDSVVCGDLPTISILLGLFPMEYYANATAILYIDEELVNSHLGSEARQMHRRLAWKRPISGVQRIHFDELELSHLLYRIYREMFSSENLGNILSKMNIQMMQNNSTPHYHRGSFACILRLVKGITVVDWEKMVDFLLDFIHQDTALVIANNYFQELYLHLHLLGVYSMPTFHPSFNRAATSYASRGLKAWKDIPAVLCLTLQVPRAKLKVFTELSPRELGTPPLHCAFQVNDHSHNIFSILQLSFGKISTSGVRNSTGFRVHVAEDKTGWAGSSPLIVSFYVPTWVALLEPELGQVALGLQSTPQSCMTFMKALGVHDCVRDDIGRSK